jgi:hypothetical protein
MDACVQCQRLDDPVTPENGVWIPDLDAHSVPIHNRCVASWMKEADQTATDKAAVANA